MSEHKVKSQIKQDDGDLKHHLRQKDSQPLYDKFHSWEQGTLSIGETPFRPRGDQHTALLAMAPSDEGKVNIVSHLQQTYGNRYVQRLIESMNVQAKLAMNAPNDAYEQEADRVAGAVTKAATSQMQHKEAEEEEVKLQQHAAESPLVTTSEHPNKRINTAPLNGQPMSTSVLDSFEPRFGIDFGDIPIARVPLGPVIQRKITGLDLNIGQARKIGDKLDQPVDVAVSHDAEDDKAISIKRQTRAAMVWYDPIPGKLRGRYYSMTRGGDVINSWTPAVRVPAGTKDLWEFTTGKFREAPWQYDGPGEHNVKRGKGQITVKDAPGFARTQWIRPRAWLSEFTFLAEDTRENQGMPKVERYVIAITPNDITKLK
jgi:hypothetical protein